VEKDVKIEHHQTKPMTKEEAIQSPKSEAKDFNVTGGSNKREQADAVLNRAREILHEFGDRESNIPVDNEYWGLMNTHRALVKDNT